MSDGERPPGPRWTSPETRVVSNRVMEAAKTEFMASVHDIGQQLYAQPSDRPTVIAKIAAAAGPVRLENQYRSRDGQILTFSLNVRTVRNARGRIVYIEGFVEDITRQRQAEAAVRSGAALERFRLMVERQGGDSSVADDPGRLPVAEGREIVRAARAGYVTGLDALLVGRACAALGGGRETAEDRRDLARGLGAAERPPGEVRADLRSGIVASVIATVNRDPKRRPRAFAPGDFMPKFEDETPQKTARQIYQEFRDWAILAGAKAPER